MKISDAWIEQVEEDYCLYLEQLDPDIYPMSYEAFEWMMVRELQQEHAEIEEGHYEYAL